LHTPGATDPRIRSGGTGPTVGGALLTATAFGTIGALIGGAFPKRE
jgi:hypothetical protein